VALAASDVVFWNTFLLARWEDASRGAAGMGGLTVANVPQLDDRGARLKEDAPGGGGRTVSYAPEKNRRGDGYWIETYRT